MFFFSGGPASQRHLNIKRYKVIHQFLSAPGSDFSVFVLPLDRKTRVRDDFLITAELI